MSNIYLFLICACVGVSVSLLLSFMHLAKVIVKNNLLVCVVMDFCAHFVGGAIVFAMAHTYVFGKFEFYCLIGYIVGYTLAKNTFSNLIVKLIDLLYYNFVKLFKKLQKTRLGMFVSK